MKRRLSLIPLIPLLLTSCLFGAKTPTPVLPIYQPTGDEPGIITALKELPVPAGGVAQTINYVSYTELFASRHITPPTADAFRASSVSWADVTGNVVSDLQLPTRVSRLDEMQDTMGFTSLDVSSEISYGSNGLFTSVVRGNLDPAAVTTALARRFFTETKYKNLTLLCTDPDCANGLIIDDKHSYPADPFGGAEGRRQPTYPGKGILINSADPQLIPASINHQGPAAADPLIAHLVAAALKLGSIRQMRIMPAGDVGVSGMTYFAMVDAWEGNQQIAAVMLCCADQGTASALGDQFKAGLRTHGLPSTSQTALAQIAAGGGAVQPPDIDAADPSQSLVTVAITYLTPVNATTLQDAVSHGTARQYQLLYDLLQAGILSEIMAGK